MRKLGLAVTAVGALMARADEIVLFDAASTPLAAVASHSGGTFALNAGVLEIATQGNTGYPGVRVKGQWDLSGYSRLSLEIVHRGRVTHAAVAQALGRPYVAPLEALDATP